MPKKTTKTPPSFLLPRDRETLSKYIKELAIYYNFTVNDRTTESVCTAIMHMPQPQFKDVPSFCARYVLDGLAKNAAYEQLKEFDDKRKQEEKEKQIASIEKNADVIPIQN